MIFLGVGLLATGVVIWFARLGLGRRNPTVERRPPPHEERRAAPSPAVAQIQQPPPANPPTEQTEFVPVESLPFMRARPSQAGPPPTQARPIVADATQIVPPVFESRPDKTQQLPPPTFDDPPTQTVEVPAFFDRTKTEPLVAAPFARPEPVAIEVPPLPAPAPPMPTVVGLTSEELAAQLDAAVDAYGRWQRARTSMSIRALAIGPEATLQRALGVVATASEDASRELLETVLQEGETEPDRRAVVALALLRRNERRALELIDSLVGDQALAPRLHEVLLLWRDRETDWRLCQQARRAGASKPFWLELLELRRVDPRTGLLDDLLGSDDPELRRRGLELAKYHEDPAARSRAAQPHLNDMRHPALRMAAVEITLLDRQPIAWMFCRQMANAPDYPRATELIAALGTASELDPLLRRLAGAPGDALLRICRSGRKAAARLAADRLRDHQDDTLAAAGLRYVIGEPEGDQSVAALLERWTELEPSLADDCRTLYGEAFGAKNAIRRCFTGDDDHHHRALGDELFFRSRGRIRWIGRGFAADMLAALDVVETSGVALEHGWEQGWGAP